MHQYQDVVPSALTTWANHFVVFTVVYRWARGWGTTRDNSNNNDTQENSEICLARGLQAQRGKDNVLVVRAVNHVSQFVSQVWRGANNRCFGGAREPVV